MTEEAFSFPIDNGAFVAAVYRAVLGREPDEWAAQNCPEALASGRISRAAFISEVAGSFERWSKTTNALFSKDKLPDLSARYPGKYARAAHTEGRGYSMVFVANAPEDFDWIEQRILDDGYYETLGEWILTPDPSFSAIANQILDLGGKSVLEIGCSTGQVMAELIRDGLDVNGLEISHFALSLAVPEIRKRIFYGDLLSAKIDRTYDVIVGLDVFEHLNPNKIRQYIDTCVTRLNPGGALYINSPMFGQDRVFGEIFDVYLEDWRRTPDGLFRLIETDERGWPVGGHLIWARVEWWERLFGDSGLVRDEAAERMLHAKYSAFFDKAPARNSFFVLRKRAGQPL